MLFADWFTDAFFGFIFFFGIVGWASRRLFAKFDNDGAVKSAAKNGAVRMISRWLK
jgi:hypothetical protein